MPLTTASLKFESALLSMDRVAAKDILASAGEGVGPLARVEQIVVPAMERIGLGWESGEVALSQVYMSGRICEDLVDSFLPAASPDRRAQPAMAVAVLDDFHLLGKRLVYSALRASGYELVDYGSQKADALIRRVSEEGIEILLISTLMLPSALRVAQVREGLDRLGCRAKLVVGGAPFRLDRQLWQEVGADAMGTNASEAVTLLARLVGGRS